MNARQLVNFGRSPTGLFIVFLFLFGIGLAIAHGFKDAAQQKASDEGRKSGTVRSQALQASKLPAIDPTRQPPDPNKPQVVETVPGNMIPFDPPEPSEVPAAKEIPAPAKAKHEPKTLPPISLYAAAPEPSAARESLSADYAPFGRLVQCELIITVDSAFIKTPIVGLVTDDVWHNGRLIIPAGTEIHGTAEVDRERERIASGNQWTFVWQSGEELSVTGIALDREHDPSGAGWGITDGSAGLRGQIIKSDDEAEIKLFAATLLSGAASSLKKTEPTILGTRAVPNLANAPLAGAEDVLSVYAQQILQTIQRDGFYVRVPAGKQFYVYITQTIDRQKAMIGGHRLAANEQPELPSDEVKRSDELFLQKARPQTINPPNSTSILPQMPLRLQQ